MEREERGCLSLYTCFSPPHHSQGVGVSNLSFSIVKFIYKIHTPMAGNAPNGGVHALVGVRWLKGDGKGGGKGREESVTIIWTLGRRCVWAARTGAGRLVRNWGKVFGVRRKTTHVVCGVRHIGLSCHVPVAGLRSEMQFPFPAGWTLLLSM